MASAGNGRSNAWASAAEIPPSPSQAAWSAGSRMTGMRSWIGATSALASQVMTAQDSSAAPSGPIQSSHSPAKAKAASSARQIR